MNNDDQSGTGNGRDPSQGKESKIIPDQPKPIAQANGNEELESVVMIAGISFAAVLIAASGILAFKNYMRNRQYQALNDLSRGQDGGI